MKRLLLLVLLLASLAGSVQAQEEPTLESLEIALWPEYDRPEVLVIYRGLLGADVPLPAVIEIAVPARVGQPTAMAYVDEAGQRFNQQYTTRVEGDRLIVTFELSTTAFQLEYYDALPADAAGKRSYTFAYAADYDTAALNLEFQEPPTAQGFALVPPTETVIVGGDGLNYHLIQAGALATGVTREWTFSYVKSNADLTAASMSGQSEATAPSAPVPTSSGDTTIWIFLVAFVVLIAVGTTGYWLGHRTQPASQAQPAPSPQKRRGSGRGDQVQRRSAVSDVRFCHQCGAELRSDSIFCHTCGTSVRSG